MFGMAPCASFLLAGLLLAFGAGQGLCAQSTNRRLLGGGGDGSMPVQVANGTEAQPGQFPYVAALYGKYLTDFRGMYHYCGGALIDPYVIMTAAHCTYVNGADRLPEYIRVGMVDVNDATVPKRTVAKLHRHPDYNDNTMENDVALLQLSKPINKIPALKLARAATRINDAEGLTVLGFGKTEAQGLSRQLLYTDVSYVNRADCEEYYGDSIPSTTMCAGTGRTMANDACVGDSGGPLITRDGLQVGIVSFGPPTCGGLGHVGGYTDVIVLRKWINAKLKEIRRSARGLQ